MPAVCRSSLVRGLIVTSAGMASLPVAWFVWSVAPHVRDDLVLDRVVRAVALDWRDFGPERAHERLQYELDHQRIGMHVPDEACALSELGALRRVRCAWTIRLGVPGVGWEVPMSFTSEATVDPLGDLQ